MRPAYKELYLKAKKDLERLRTSQFTILEEGDRDCEHSFSWIVDSQDGGLVGATYTCYNCDMKIDQLIGERYTPENIPKDPSITRWRE